MSIIELMNENAYIWFGIAVFFIIIEVMIGSFFLIWLGGAAALVALLKWFMPDLLCQQQVLIFSITSLISILLWKRYLKN